MFTLICALNKRSKQSWGWWFKTSKHSLWCHCNGSLSMLPVNYVSHFAVLPYCDFLFPSCDRGGDCECLCTAIANFAERCRKAGFSVHWRSNHLCRKYFFWQQTSNNSHVSRKYCIISWASATCHTCVARYDTVINHHWYKKITVMFVKTDRYKRPC